MTLKEIETNPDHGLAVVGFIDDNIRIKGRKVRGYPVLGRDRDLDEIIKRHDIGKIIVSFREHGMEKKREIKKLCQKMGVEADVVQMKLVID